MKGDLVQKTKGEPNEKYFIYFAGSIPTVFSFHVTSISSPRVPIARVSIHAAM